MALYHFSAKVISRAAGSSAVAAAAYRSASRLHDERLDRSHDFSNKAGVVHSEVMLPDGVPQELGDRAALWNAVEAGEKRIDAQLAREIEFAIPRELDQAQGIRLAREFVKAEFVDRGMIADLNVHWDIGADGLAKPHAHVMLSMREVGEDGFGAKARDWNKTELLEHWREAWGGHVNRRLAELDIDARVDHRSLEAQGIDLDPQHKIGPAASRMAGQGLALERIDEHAAIARANGAKLLRSPGLALDAITHQQSTFTGRDLAMFVHRHSDGKEQFDRVLAAVKASPELVALGKDGRGEQRFTSRAMIETEQRLQHATATLDASRRHGLHEQHRKLALVRAEMRGLLLSSEQQTALTHVTEAKGLGVVVGYAGTGKSAMLGVAREAWESASYRVHGVALSGIAAENLESGSGIASRTIASLEHQWAKDRDLLSPRDVLVVDEAGMIGTRQLERIIGEAQRRGAKVVLVGDPEQLQAIEAGAAFRGVAERHGAQEITEIRRQREEWQRAATRQLATGRTAEAVHAYAEHGQVHGGSTRDATRIALIERWDRDRQAMPTATRVILTHTNDEVRALNLDARERLREAGELGRDVQVATERGARAFATGDRVMFLQNERSLGVKNGSLGTIDSVSPARMAVLLDDGRAVAFDVKDYAALDHGYAATVHKAQGVTVDRVHVLATPGLDRHAAYVALSRHRERVDLHYGQDDFADQRRLVHALARDRGKDMASDYSQQVEQGAEPAAATPPVGRFARLRLKPAAPTIEQVVTPLDKAVERFARAAADIARMQDKGLPTLPHQRQAMDVATKALEAERPEAARDLGTVLAAKPELIADTASGRTAAVLRAMTLEAEMRIDTGRRADRFVADWQRQARQYEALTRAGEYGSAERVREGMSHMAKSLQRDPQLESLLRNRVKELGIGTLSGAGLSHDLQDWRGLSRGRGLGI